MAIRKYSQINPSSFQGLFSRITFREPLYVGGSNNLTSLAVRLGVTTGLQGCVRRLQINDHVYRFHKNDALREPNPLSDYAALDGFDISRFNMIKSNCYGLFCYIPSL